MKDEDRRSSARGVCLHKLILASILTGCTACATSHIVSDDEEPVNNDGRDVVASRARGGDLFNRSATRPARLSGRRSKHNPRRGDDTVAGEEAPTNARRVLSVQFRRALFSARY